MATMTITFGDDYPLDFDIEPHPISELWIEKMRQRHAWPMDDPKRFYGFDPPEISRERAEQALTDCIQIINSYQPIIQRTWTSIDDQDMLNYLHSIFERYHGLLDAQDHDWWQQTPSNVREALARLNIAVHRAESTAREDRPRVVCTWFGMPKDSQMEPEHMLRYGNLAYEFGGVYLNYVEIGKTLEDLSEDDDRWIGDDAFQPFQRYSADFNIRFYDAMADIARIYRYFEQHREFFDKRGIRSLDDYRIMPRRYRVARLRMIEDRDHILDQLRTRQRITDIYLP